MKAARKGCKYRVANFSSTTGRPQDSRTLKYGKKKNCHPIKFTASKQNFKNKGKIKKFSTKRKQN